MALTQVQGQMIAPSTTLTTPTLTTPNITSGLTLTGAAGTVGQVLSSGGSGSAPTWATVSSDTVGFKNRIINGAMGIWQRGTSGFGPGVYGADRWYLDGVSATSQRSTDVPSTSFQYSNEWGYPGSASCSIRQRIESLNSFDLAGQTITVSLWAKSTSGTTALSYSLDYPTATDNFSSLTNISSFVQIGASSLSTSWTYYTFTVSIPAGATTGLQLSFNRNTGGSATTRITGVQLEKGSSATSFDYRSFTTELTLCQRYFEKSFNYEQIPANGPNTSSFVTNAGLYGGYCSNNFPWGGVVYYKVTKRTGPSITTYGNSNGQGWANGGFTANAFGDSGGGTQSMTVNQQAVGGYTPVSAHWTASAEL